MPDDDAQERASRPEPSEFVKACPQMMELWAGRMLPDHEIERRARGAHRLKEAYSSVPWHAEAAKSDPAYWSLLYASRVNS